MTPVVSHLVIDCANPAELARWWAQVLGWRIVWEAPPPAEPEIGIAPDSELAFGGLLFGRAPDRKVVKNRLHLDLRPPDGSTQAAELERLLGLGARPVDIGQGDVPWHVLADPEGNEFCLLRATQAEADAAVAAQASTD